MGAGLASELGINPKDAIAAKKPDLSLVPPVAILHEAMAMMDGAAKYGPYNWRGKKVQARVYVAAAKRHLDAWLEGEEYSTDTIEKERPVHHLGHARACLGILLDALETGNLMDDRAKGGAYDRVMLRIADKQCKLTEAQAIRMGVNLQQAVQNSARTTDAAIAHRIMDQAFPDPDHEQQYGRLK